MHLICSHEVGIYSLATVRKHTPFYIDGEKRGLPPGPEKSGPAFLIAFLFRGIFKKQFAEKFCSIYNSDG